MKVALFTYLCAVLAFVVIDGLWLGLVARSFYADALGDLLRKSPLLAPAAAFYLCYVAGLVFLAVRPQEADVTLASVACYGAVVGFLAYGTYDMTNWSTLKDWPVLLSVVDVIWGTILSASVAVIARLASLSFS